jgi:alginate O-acetyltransferase complex protein AlgI
VLFNSFGFLIFLLIVFAAYYARQERRWQLAVLILSSFIFYAWAQPALLLLLLASILLNSWVSWKVDQPIKTRRAWACFGIVMNLLLLSMFKYGSLISNLLCHLTGDVDPAKRTLTFLLYLPLPVGISFYTFEGISLVVDSFKKKPEGSCGTFAQHLCSTSLFMSFFPHLIAGPIVRPRQFYPQIGGKRFAEINWDAVSKNLILGFFLKSAIADNLAAVTKYSFTYAEYDSSVNNIAALFAFTIRLFADFAGYSYIAIGLAAAFGYVLPVNFNMPYRSQSLSEFWTRWHMTLSQWLADYLYVPLGGNRKGDLRTLANLIIVMGLGGLWHGADLRFLFWGLYHGVGLAAERVLGLRKPPSDNVAIAALRICLVFTFFSIGLAVFAMSLKECRIFVESVVSNWQYPVDSINLKAIGLLSLPIITWHIFDVLKEKKAALKMKPSFAYDFCLGTMLFLVVTNFGFPEDFVYFRF